MFKRFRNPFADEELRRLAKMTAMCLVIGLVAGLGAAGFFVMLEAGNAAMMGGLANYHPQTPAYEKPMFEFGEGGAHDIRRWVFLLLPAIGGLLSGVIVFTFAPEAEGHGTDAAIEAYHFKDGAVRSRVPFVKAITSMITIGTGGSAGREGPIAQIGSGFGSMLGRWMNVSPHERRILMVSGMAAGIGAIFHAPLAGALFAAEVLYREPDFEHEVIVPGFISSIVAYSVFGTIFGGFHPLFEATGLTFDNALTLLPYLILALVSAGGAYLYVKVFYGFRNVMFHRIQRIPNHFKPAIGGVLVGVVGFFLPEALGAGYGIVQRCFDGADQLLTLPSAAGLTGLFPEGMNPVWHPILLLLIIGLAKIATTAFSIGSGGSGGVFGPAVVIGGAFGGATGLVCAQLFPGMDIQLGAFTLVGMAGFFAGAAHTPVSTIIMVSEMTGNYNLLLPSMLVCIVAFAACRRFTLYEKQLSSRLEAPSKLGNMASAILRCLTVEQALQLRPAGPLIRVRGDAPLGELVERFALSTQECFPIVDENEQLTGIIESRDIRRTITELGMADLIIARDLEVPASTIMPQDSLLSAVNTLAKSGREELVVCDPQDQQKILGIVSRGDVINCYNRQIAAAT